MKVKFTYCFTSHQGIYSEVHEVPDTSADEDLQQMLEDIVNERVDAYYERLVDEVESES